MRHSGRFRGLMGADGPSDYKSEWLSVLFRIRPGESRLRGRKTIPRSDLIMAALPIRTKPHLPERASKLQDISTEFFQGHRPCFAFIMARSEMPSPKGFMNRRSNAFSHVFLYGRPGRLRKPEMRACVRFLAKEGQGGREQVSVFGQAPVLGGCISEVFQLSA
jgi:hypothetical protein